MPGSRPEAKAPFKGRWAAGNGHCLRFSVFRWVVPVVCDAKLSMTWACVRPKWRFLFIVMRYSSVFTIVYILYLLQSWVYYCHGIDVASLGRLFSVRIPLKTGLQENNAPSSDVFIFQVNMKKAPQALAACRGISFFGGQPSLEWNTQVNFFREGGF